MALLTGLMFAVGPTTVDFSLPSMPSIQHDIGTGHMRVELTLTFLLLGLTVTQFIFGAIADRYGRRRTILIALVIYSLAALGASFANNLVMFSVARLGQAVGFGIATPAHVRAVSEHADGVIIGSALLDKIAGLRAESAATAAKHYILSLSNALTR